MAGRTSAQHGAATEAPPGSGGSASPAVGAAGIPAATTQDAAVPHVPSSAQTGKPNAVDGGSQSDASSARADSCTEPCAQPAMLAPELLDTWTFPWTGGNLSFFQIALCPGGAAEFLFAESPGAVDVTRILGSYVARDAHHVLATFAGSAPRPGLQDLTFDLRYDAARKSLVRATWDDGYNHEGFPLGAAGVPSPMSAMCP